MKVNTACPHCGTSFTAWRHSLGRWTRCLTCGQAFIVKEEGMPQNESTDPKTHEAAIRMARACRNVVQACLIESEWKEADYQFFLIIRAELERLKSGK